MTEPTKIKHLVISGGGGTGFAYYGILRESNKDGFWNIDDIETIHGVSVGSFFAFFIAILKHIGWDAYDDYIIKRPWEDMFSTEKLFNAYNNVGIMGRETVECIFSPILRAVDLSLNITLQELYEFTGIELHFYTTNLDSYEYVDLSHKTHPDWGLIDAAYCSCAIPVVFRPNRMNGELYVDGAFLCNYPIQKCIDQVENPDEIFGINKISTRLKTKSLPFDSLGKEMGKNTETENYTPKEEKEENEKEKEGKYETPEYGNIIDYLLDIIAKTVKKIAIEKTKSKYTIDVVDNGTNVWEIYKAIQSKESRSARIQYGVETWNEFKQQIGVSRATNESTA
jgi:predicted acylesterase/phospholipase RssA